jgi:multiple sugar transport system substrate-binding protein
VINQWNQAHPENKVTIVDVPGEPDQQHDRMADDAGPGGAHEADVYVLDNVWLPEFIRRGHIRPLDDALQAEAGIVDSDFLANVLDTCRDLDGGGKGKWCLPLNADAGLLFYHPDLPGVQEPTSWDDYLGDSAKETLAEVRKNPAMVGAFPEAATAAQFADEEILTINALEAIWTAGGEVVNRDGQLVFDRDGSVEFDARAKAALVNLSRALQDREITLPDSDEADEDESITAFADGRAMFMRNWPVAYDKLTKPSDRDPISLGVTTLAGPSVLGGQNLAISSSSDKPRAAQALIQFLTSSASQLILFDIGGFAPTRPEVYANTSDASRPYARDLRSAVEGARPRPVTACYTEFSRVFREGILRALRNRGQLESGFPQELASTVQKCPT